MCSPRMLQVSISTTYSRLSSLLLELSADLRSWDYIMSMSAVLCNRAEGLNFQILTNLNIKPNGRERWKSWLRRQKVFFFKLEPLELASWWQSYEKLLEKDRLNWIWKNYSNQIEISNRQIWKCFLCSAVSLFFSSRGCFKFLCLSVSDERTRSTLRWCLSENEKQPKSGNRITPGRLEEFKSWKQWPEKKHLKKRILRKKKNRASRLRKWIWYI